MPSQTYDIYFSGQIMDGKDPAETRQQVGKLFKVDQKKLERLFSGTPVRIKNGVDEETAAKYRVAFRKAGALVEIKASNLTAESIEANNNTDQAGSSELTLLPPNSGSLIDCAPKITPQQLPDINHLSVAPAGSLIDCAPEITPQPLPDIEHLSVASLGAILDESSKPEPLEIDTEDLDLNPANTGTLEDCKKEVEPYPIPDIRHLDLD